MATPKKGYFNADGKRIPGTTTIIGRFKDSGGLIHWAYNQGKDGKELYEERDKAAECGTLAHEMVEAYLRKQDHMAILKSVPEEMATKALNAFQMFRDWKDQTRIEIITDFQEVSMVSEQYQYGGTPDAIGILDGKHILLDWKTSNAVYSDYLMQLAAYKLLWEENGHPEINGGFYLCRFSKEFPDFSAHYFGELDLAEKQFLLLRKAYENDKELSKRVK